VGWESCSLVLAEGRGGVTDCSLSCAAELGKRGGGEREGCGRPTATLPVSFKKVGVESARSLVLTISASGGGRRKKRGYPRFFT